MTVAQRVQAFRSQLKKHGLGGYIIPRADEHQGEYVAPYRDRLKYMTHFSGSAGLAVVLHDCAGLFVDGRYTLQAGLETDRDVFDVVPLAEVSSAAWIGRHTAPGSVIGYDPWLLTANDVAQYEKTLSSKNITLKAVPHNLVDAIWTDQPPAPMGVVVPHDDRYAGVSAADKIRHMAQLIQDQNAHGAVITTAESVNWLFNIRGDDVPCVPAALAYGTVHADGTAHLFIRRGKLSDGVLGHLANCPGVVVREEGDIVDHLTAQGASNTTYLFDPALAPIYLTDLFENAGGVVRFCPEITLRPKAMKNNTEISGARSAHIRDGVALVSFLSELEDAHARCPLTELDLVARLESWRQKSDLYRGPSFSTIAGSGPNGAIIHYRVSAESNRTLQDGDIVLLDSGAQYPDGTTDVTRTFFLQGRDQKGPTAEQKDLFTRVLKGHIALASARFPVGTTGSQLDILARSALWYVGCDYAHGTGHGVGSYLSVHEGPQRISTAPNTVPLDVGMIVSNEPGYYRPDGFGIRIENLVVVRQSVGPRDEKPMLAFDTLTLCPIDRTLIDGSLLTLQEKDWINNYHKNVWDILSPLVDGPIQAWLALQTRGLS